MRALDIRQRISAFEGLFIEHPRVVEAELAIVDLELRRTDVFDHEDNLLYTDTSSGDTFRFDDSHSVREDVENHLTQYCVFVVGEAGSGKTRLKDRIASRPEFKQVLNDGDADVVPLLYFDMPNTPTPKALLTELCEKAGLVLPSRITRNELARNLRRQLSEISTKLIVIDEAHTLVEGFRDRGVIEAARCLKFLLNTCGVPIVLLGEEPLARLEISKALKRRVDCHINLTPYSWSIEEERYEFLNYLDQLDDALAFSERCGFADNQDLSSRLYFVSGGHIGLVTKYLSKALKLALRMDAGTINAGFLAKAYRELHPVKFSTLSDPDLVLTEFPDHPNPFTVDRTEFKKMWAEKFCAAEVPDTSAVVARMNRSKKPAGVFSNG